ncbi:MAG: magnesium chelatase subunit D [Alphaproteobacteria bacterium]
MTQPTDAAPRDASGDALLICKLLATDPRHLGGVALASGPGPGRDAFLACYRHFTKDQTPLITVPSHVSVDRLEGGLDIAATLARGKSIKSQGLMAAAENGALLLLSAERLSTDKAARIALAMDDNLHTPFGLIACDESRDDDEALPAILSERLAFRINPDQGIAALKAEGSLPKNITAAADAVTLPENIERALAETALMLGIASPRALIFAFRVTKLHAALNRRKSVNEEDAALAAQLVFAHRATQMPVEESEAEDQSEEHNNESQPDSSDTDSDSGGALADRVLDAVRTHLPEGLLAKLDASAFSRQGRTGTGAKAAKAGKTRGRPLGARRGDPRSGARLDLVETLRVAAPWQTLRRRTQPNRSGVLVHKDDFRVRRFKESRETTAIFVVDASGSSAIRRLAEAKGAVELILADCYVRRDRVAVIAFRSKSAEILLHPTRSLQRAKRSLAELPGGGGTPLTAAIETTLSLADQVKRTGGVPLAVFLTDGRANITRDGTPDKTRALSESESAAKALRASGMKSLVIDLSDRPEGAAKTLATALAALYLPLPHAESHTISNHVGAAMKSAGGSR